jgi:hypothetical protein
LERYRSKRKTGSHSFARANVGGTDERLPTPTTAPPHKIYAMTNGTMTTVAQPNATLYVSNIDWKVKKSLLRRALYALFSNHGKVRKLTECCALELPPTRFFSLDLIVFTLACFCRF